MLASAMRPAVARPAVASVFRSQPFGTIPQPPGGIVGGVNDPVAIPPPSKSHGSLHWTTERALVVGMVPLLVAPMAGASLSPILDGTLGGLILLHSHFGFESCIIDYIPLRVFGIWHKLALGALFAGTATAAYGIYELESKDVGIVGAVGKIWNA